MFSESIFGTRGIKQGIKFLYTFLPFYMINPGSMPGITYSLKEILGMTAAQTDPGEIPEHYVVWTNTK